MPRGYRHIEQYEEEICELQKQGFTKREIGEKLGLSKEQIKGVLQRKKRRERKLSYGIVPKKRGRPPKCSAQSNTEKDFKYQLAQKEARIRQLEMENELMRDFLSLTERK